MQVTAMKCNGIPDPLGFDLQDLMLSWIVDGEPVSPVVRSRVRIASDADFRDILEDTGESETIDPRGYFPSIGIVPATRYYWEVTAEAADGSRCAGTAFFEGGRPEGDWQAEWIRPGWEDREIHPLFRGEVQVTGEVSSARAYVCGLGLYELYVNGTKAGGEYLTPDCNAYDKWIQYQTYDLTDSLRPGRNVLASLTGNGWYKGRFTFSELTKEIYGDGFAFLLELDIRYKDGRRQISGTDAAWKNSPGFIVSGNIYDGEIQDMTRCGADWAGTDFDDSSWTHARVFDFGYERLSPRRSLPVRVMQRIRPAGVLVTPKGETLLDMGQNMVGWLEVDLTRSAPRDFTLRFGELLQDGCFFNTNLRTAKQRFEYVSDGRARVVRPYFTFFGFRYVKLEGFGEDPDPSLFTGCVVYSDMRTTGRVETSHPLVNRLFENAMWGQRGNFVDVPTDCPQRDERMGWTGDAQIFCATACMNMDADAFFRKYLYDMQAEQSSRDGNVPQIIPSFRMGELFGGIFDGMNSAAWGDAATIIPWTLYVQYGDLGVLRDRYGVMKGWVDLIRRQDDGSRLWKTGAHFGDWLASDVIDKNDPFGATPKELIASAYYAHSARLVSKAAAVLGYTADAAEYAALADEVRNAIRGEFVTRTGRLAADTQTGYVLMLYMDLVQEEFRAKFAEALAALIVKNKYRILTGFVGTPYILHVLTANGYHETACRMLLNEEMPGWLYPVKMGATTIWERWNAVLPDGRIFEVGMTSLNHYAYGSVAEWMYRDLCGINPDESAPGYRAIRLTPHPDPLLVHAGASLDSASGRITSRWEYTPVGWLYECRVPPGSTAAVELPCAAGDRVYRDGVPVVSDDSTGSCGGSVFSARLGPGEYRFRVEAHAETPET